MKKFNSLLFEFESHSRHFVFSTRSVGQVVFWFVGTTQEALVKWCFGSWEQHRKHRLVVAFFIVNMNIESNHNLSKLQDNGRNVRYLGSSMVLVEYGLVGGRSDITESTVPGRCRVNKQPHDEPNNINNIHLSSNSAPLFQSLCCRSTYLIIYI